MIKKVCLYVIVLCLAGNGLFAQVKQDVISKSDMLKLDFKSLAEKKTKVLARDASVIDAYKVLIKDAAKLLDYAPVSVMDKKAFPPSGNKHDYMSIAPYWWPDPSKPGGTPYIHRDGEINPEVHDFTDKENMPTVCENVYKLALAYYFSNDEAYAKHAAKLVQVWFLDTVTKMNPNLNYAQAVKGVAEGRAEGLIDTRHFIYLIDAIELLKSSKHWTAQNQADLKQWFTEFYAWMNTSKNGKAEMNAKNNHGIWFDAQSLAIALYIEKTDEANKIIARTTKRLDEQMNNDGFFPLELARTTSLHYSTFIMNALNIVALLSEKTNVNLWTYETPSGKSYKKGVDALVPYLIKEKEWTGQEIRPFNFEDGYPILLRAASHYDCKECQEGIKKLAGDKYKELMIDLL